MKWSEHVESTVVDEVKQEVEDESSSEEATKDSSVPHTETQLAKCGCPKQIAVNT